MLGAGGDVQDGHRDLLDGAARLIRNRVQLRRVVSDVICRASDLSDQQAQTFPSAFVARGGALKSGQQRVGDLRRLADLIPSNLLDRPRDGAGLDAEVAVRHRRQAIFERRCIVLGDRCEHTLDLFDAASDATRDGQRDPEAHHQRSEDRDPSTRTVPV